MNVRILIVDDHPVVRSGLRRDLEQNPALTVVEEATCSQSALEAARRLNPDLIIMDVHLGATSGIDATREILKEFPLLRIIIFSADANRALVDEALDAGALGYLLKTSPPEEINRAVQTAMEGRLYLCSEVAEPIFKDYKKILAAKPAQKSVLTQRQTDVIRLIAQGLQNKEVADKLGISVKAAERTRSRIMNKLGYRSVAELARYAAREGIVSD